MEATDRGGALSAQIEPHACTPPNALKSFEPSRAWTIYVFLHGRTNIKRCLQMLAARGRGTTAVTSRCSMRARKLAEEPQCLAVATRL